MKKQDIYKTHGIEFKDGKILAPEFGWINPLFKRRYDVCGDENQKAAAREHWVACHKENLAKGRYDLIMFSGQMLSAMGIDPDIVLTEVAK